MTDKHYIDLESMQKRADADFQSRDKSWESFNKQQERAKKEQEEANELFRKSILSERKEAEKKRAAEIEEEKAKAIAEVEAKYESQGVKSEKTKQRDAAFKSMLGNIRGMND